MDTRPIRKILIANRGEIAVRVARACAERGITSVAIVSEADREAMHARVADEVFEVGPAALEESYLAGARIVEAALEVRADAIHPGYGFLSENSDFAESVAAAGLVFIGPPAEAMRATGLKTAARKTMESAGVPVVPAATIEGEIEGERLEEAARGVGFPLLVKAAAGGGGKGMRIVRALDELGPAVEAARGEAQRSFGDGRVFLERYLEGARHIEIQIVADGFGTVASLFERECSIQRRYQKIVEEAPSPVVEDELRRRMADSAVAAARAVGYVNAGTVEFLLDAEGNHYFLEMNARLQVEHPVTELVCGLDLVGLQLDVAAGRPLHLDGLSRRGHAIEARIYAEDPSRDFTPSTGRLHRVRWPSGPGIRVDAGVETGDEVSHRYDPMLAKLIVHAADRSAAIARMRRALEETVVLGVATNLDLLRTVLAHPTFVGGEATTSFVEGEMIFEVQEGPSLDEDAILSMALAESLAPGDGRRGGDPVGGEAWSPWGRSDGFRMGR